MSFQALQVSCDSFFDVFQSLRTGLSLGNAARQGGYFRNIYAVFILLNEYSIFHLEFLLFACLRDVL